MRPTCCTARADHDVAPPTALAFHAGADTVPLEQADEVTAGELALLAGIKVSGTPCLLMASSTASRQKAVLRLLGTREASTRRVAQSSTAAR